MNAWRQQPISRMTSSLLKPESFASAGFFYSGTADNVMCFWCGLHAGYAALPNMKPADYSFVRDVQEIAGAGAGAY